MIFLELSSKVLYVKFYFNISIYVLLLSKLYRRIVQSGGPNTKIQWTGHDGGTQTQIHPGYEEKKETERRPTGAGEVRVIVQPIQPVFYMPRQSKKIYKNRFIL